MHFNLSPKAAWKRLLCAKRDITLFLVGGLCVCAVWGGYSVYVNTRTPLPYSGKVAIAWLPSSVTRWDQQIETEARKYNVDANYIAILMTMESGGNPNAVSEDNAVGLMQVTAPTAGDIAQKYLKKPVQSYNLRDPATSIEFGAAYLAYLRNQFGTIHQGPDWNVTAELVAAGYNGGPGAAKNLADGKGLDDTQTVVYSRDTYNMWRERWSSTSPTFDRWQERGGSALIKAAQ